MKRPNILFFLPDQLRADYLSCYGARHIHTPHIDSLAADGALYSRAYSASPVCVPARVSLITGMNAIKTSVLDNSHFLPPGYHASGLRTWPELLVEAGYHTAAIGKMHFYPWEASLGFQERIIAEDKIWVRIQDDYAQRLAEHGYQKTVGNDKPEYHANHGAFVSDIPWDLQVDRYVGQETCRYLREYDREEPFALMVGFPGPHNPYDPAPEFARLFDAEDMPAPIPAGDDPLQLEPPGAARKSWYAIENPEFTERHMRIMRAYYAALVAQIDHEVGDILATLRERGMLENTLVIFSTDHGDYLGDHGLTGKNSFFEPATRVPLLVRAPGGGRTQYDGLVELTDVTATILAHAGVPVPEHMDARPLPAAGLDVHDGRPYVVGMLGTGWMVVDGDWKLCKYANGQAMLFHLPTDPCEERNRYADPACTAECRRLDAALTRELVRSVRAACHERRVMAGSLSNSDEFGRRGWQRPHPGQVEK